MSHKTRNVKSSTLRIDGHAKEMVERMQMHTGWTVGKIGSLLINAGIAAIEEREKIVAGCRQLVEAAVAHHAVEDVAKKNLGRTAANLSTARKQLKAVIGGAL